MIKVSPRSAAGDASSSDAAPLRLLLVTDNRLMGEALAAALTDNRFVATVTCVDSSRALIWAQRTLVDAILIDATDPENSGLVGRLRSVVQLRPIIACGIRETDDEILLWAEAGVTGYLPNSIHPAQAIDLLSAILRGEQPCSGRAAAVLLRRIAETEPTAGSASEVVGVRRLTRRELQVAELISVGLSDKQIARDLGISVATTKTHVHNLLGKLNLGHRGEVGRLLAGANLLGGKLLLRGDADRLHYSAAAD
jgi:two-component system nitrate/nitrite response regulator NarL